MAISTSQTPSKGPAVLARETLIEMAKANQPPTPANYKRFYENIAGVRTPDDTDSSMIQQLYERLKLQDSPLVAEWEKAVGAAFTQKNVRPIEGMILKSVAGTSSLDNSYASAFQKLQERLKLQNSPFVAEWDDAIEVVMTQRDARAIEGLILKSIPPAQAPEDSSASVLRELQNDLRQQGSPLAADWGDAIEVALAKKDGRTLKELILKSIHPAPADNEKIAMPGPVAVDKCKTCVDVRAFNGVLYLMESFAKNLTGVFAENPVLMGQIEIVMDVLEHPRNMEKLYGAKRALAKMAAADKIQAQLGEAKNSAKSLAGMFLAQIGQTEDDAGEFLKEVEAGKKALEEAKDHASILAASQTLLSGTSAVHDKMKENRTKLENARLETQDVEKKIHALEEKVKTSGEKTRQDFQSGLLNQRNMDEKITRFFVEGWEKITLALLDIDNFKRINDQLGEAAGEKAIQQLSDAIRETVGSKGVSARMESAEFVIAFSGYDGNQVKGEMERIQRLLTRQIFMADGENRVVTFSAGVAQRAEDEGPAETLSRADDAMYAAKQKGKNRVEVAMLY